MKSKTHLLPLSMLAGVVMLIVALTLWNRFDRSDNASTDAAGDAKTVTAGPAAAMVTNDRAIPRSGAANTLPADMAAKIQGIVDSRAQANAAAAKRNAQLRIQYAQIYASEKPDPVWAAAKEQALEQVASKAAAETASTARDLSTDCKRSICRTRARFDSVTAAEEWVSLYMAGMGNVTRRSMVSINPSPDGAAVVIYSSGS